MSTKDTLSPRVALLNQTNRWLNANLPTILEKLKAFGKKAYLASGGKSAKFQELTDSIIFSNPQMRIMLRTSYGNDFVLDITVQGTFGPNNNQYESYTTLVYLATIENGFLNFDRYANHVKTQLKTDYDAARVLEARRKIEELKKQMDAIRAEAELFHFENCY